MMTNAHSHYLDLTHQVWTVEEFRDHELVVFGCPHNPFEAEADKEKDAEQEEWIIDLGERLNRGIKDWRSEPENQSIFKISEALDAIARRELNTELKACVESQKNKQVYKRLQAIQDCLSHLSNLSQNLQNHDRMIDLYHHKFFTNLSVYSHHEVVLQSLNMHIQELNGLYESLESLYAQEQKNRKEEFEWLFRELEMKLQHGLIMDPAMISQFYPKFKTLIENLNHEEQQAALLRLNILSNQHYLDYLITQVSDRQMPLSFSINQLFKKWEMTEQDLQNAIEQRRQDFIHRLQHWRNMLPISLGEFNTPQLMDMVQQDFLSLAADELTHNEIERNRLQHLFAKLHEFEKQFELQAKEVEDEIKREVEALIEELKLSPEQELLEKNRLANFKFQPLTSRLIRQILSRINLNFQDVKEEADFNQAIESLERALAQAQKLWPRAKLKQKYLDDFQIKSS